MKKSNCQAHRPAGIGKEKGDEERKGEGRKEWEGRRD